MDEDLRLGRILRKLSGHREEAETKPDTAGGGPAPQYRRR